MLEFFLFRSVRLLASFALYNYTNLRTCLYDSDNEELKGAS